MPHRSAERGRDMESFFLNFPEGMPKGTSQQKGVYVRNGKPHFYKKDKIESARRQFVYALKRYAPKEPLKGNVRLTVWFVFDVKDKSKWGKWKPTRPDADGIVKEFLDAMQEVGFFKDDAQVVNLSVKKIYGECADIVVRYEELGESQNA